MYLASRKICLEMQGLCLASIASSLEMHDLCLASPCSRSAWRLHVLVWRDWILSGVFKILSSAHPGLVIASVCQHPPCTCM
jgi:hypothetical protein